MIWLLKISGLYLVYVYLITVWWRWANAEIPRDHEDAHLVWRRLQELETELAASRAHQSFN